MRLEEVTMGTILRGILPSENVTVETVKWHGSEVAAVSDGLARTGPWGRCRVGANFCLALAPGVELDRRVAELGEEIASIAKSDPVAQRLQQLRGVGPVIATALVAAVGSGEQFAKGRELAVSLGLTPKQHSTGGKERLLGISKRGDPYLRKLLVHGARAVIRHAKDKDD